MMETIIFSRHKKIRRDARGSESDTSVQIRSERGASASLAIVRSYPKFPKELHSVSPQGMKNLLPTRGGVGGGGGGAGEFAGQGRGTG